MSKRKVGCVFHRDGNVLRVNFGREPDPPAPRFPGAAGLREVSLEEIPKLGLAGSRRTTRRKLSIFSAQTGCIDGDAMRRLCVRGHQR